MAREGVERGDGGQGRNRTTDTRIFSRKPSPRHSNVGRTPTVSSWANKVQRVALPVPAIAGNLINDARMH